MSNRRTFVKQMAGVLGTLSLHNILDNTISDGL